MSWLNQLQKKSQKEKIRLVWTAALVFALLLFAVWIVTSRIPKIEHRDTSLFKIIGRGAKDVGRNFKTPTPPQP